ncbi:TM2 domain-containing protein [Brachyspira catarrhinii]|nr:TM2 domain-containing protein [Brachyspira catarrhinii]
MSEEKFCKNCGKQINEDFKICPYCGEKVQDEITENGINNYEVSTKSGIVCLLLFIPSGLFGVHKFYVRRTLGGIVMLILTITIIGAIISFILWIIDFIQLLRGNFKDAEGKYIKIENYDTENRANNYEVSPKSGIVCLLLFLKLGIFGVHRFYAGKIGSGIIMLLLFVPFIIIFYFHDIWSHMVSGLYYYNEADTIFGVMVICFITLTVWWTIDLISILRSKFKDSKGRYIKIK